MSASKDPPAGSGLPRPSGEWDAIDDAWLDGEPDGANAPNAGEAGDTETGGETQPPAEPPPAVATTSPQASPRAREAATCPPPQSAPSATQAECGEALQGNAPAANDGSREPKTRRSRSRSKKRQRKTPAAPAAATKTRKKHRVRGGQPAPQKTATSDAKGDRPWLLPVLFTVVALGLFALFLIARQH